MRWHYRDGGLLWPFVPAFAIHVAEEWFAGFTTWVTRIAGGPISDAAFFTVNGVAMALLIVGVRAATRHESNGWIAVTIATVALINTAGHVVGAVLTASYAPGLASAVILYVPLAALTLIRALDQGRQHLARGVVVAALLHAAVFTIAFAATR